MDIRPIFRTTILLASLVPSLPPLAAEPQSATVTVSGKDASIPMTITFDFKKGLIDTDTLPAFDIGAFMKDGGKSMKPGLYRLTSQWSGRTYWAGTDTPAFDGLKFNTVKVNGPDDALIFNHGQWISPRYDAHEEKSFGSSYSNAFALKRAALFDAPPAKGDLGPVLKKFGAEAMPSPLPTSGYPGASISGETRYATFSDTETLKLTAVSILLRCSVVRAVASWTPERYDLCEGVAKPSGPTPSQIDRMREAALRAYAEKQPEALKKLILARSDNPPTFDAARFVREADAALIDSLLAKGARYVVTEADAGMPESLWRSAKPEVLFTFGVLSPFGYDNRNRPAPDAPTRRYLKLVAANLPRMDTAGASDMADGILSVCRTPRLVIARNGVRLSIEHFPDGSSARGILAAPAGKEREALEMLRDEILAAIDRS